jgi:hypothetical protein
MPNNWGIVKGRGEIFEKKLITFSLVTKQSLKATIYIFNLLILILFNIFQMCFSQHLDVLGLKFSAVFLAISLPNGAGKRG